MSNKIVYQGQSFLDKVLETTGSIDNAFEMSIVNGICITDDVVIGEELKATSVTVKAAVSIFNEKMRPSTGLRKTDESFVGNLGIGKMIIGKNFIVG